MKVNLPNTTIKHFKAHSEFDKIFLNHTFKEFHELKKDYHYEIEAIGEFSGDIKWNDSALKLIWKIPTQYFNVSKSYMREGIITSVELMRFTGNCGFKAMSHLFVIDSFRKYTGEILNFIESFAYHRLNCGMLIGSDTVGGDTYSNIKKYGEGYKFSESTWNPNYTWGPTHKVLLYYKDLNEKTPDPYFQLLNE